MLRQAFLLSLILTAPVSTLAQQAPKQPDTPTTPAPGPETVVPPGVTVKTDYPGAVWAPANEGNFGKSNRPDRYPVEYIVVHDIEGSAEACVSWFQNPRARASSHYVVSGATGTVYQMVLEKDVAWHAGERTYNNHSIGIENEGYAYRPGFFDANLYEPLAGLLRDITKRWNLPRDRKHIFGHNEVPNPSRPGSFGGYGGHTDPGPYWDWHTLMTLVRNDGELIGHTIPKIIHPGEILPATVTLKNTGDDVWVANNSGREDSRIVERGGAVYLGTWNPRGRRSSFFSYKFMTSPAIASSVVTGDTEPGAEGQFSFSLYGPRKLGNVVEEFRLTKVPPMPNAPVAFGPPVKAEILVEPWLVDASAVKDGFTPKDGWNPKGSYFWRKTGVGEPVSWTVNLPIDGRWDVYAQWSPGSNRTAKAQYEVTSSDGKKLVPVDQRTGSGWTHLGRFRYDKAGPATVRLSSMGAPGIAIAEGIRFVGPIE